MASRAGRPTTDALSALRGSVEVPERGDQAVADVGRHVLGTDTPGCGEAIHHASFPCSRVSAAPLSREGVRHAVANGHPVSMREGPPEMPPPGMRRIGTEVRMVIRGESLAHR